METYSYYVHVSFLSYHHPTATLSTFPFYVYIAWTTEYALNSQLEVSLILNIPSFQVSTIFISMYSKFLAVFFF